MKAAIFDWDGTLVDTFSVANRVFKQVLGDDFTEEDLKAGFGSGVEGVIRLFLDKKGALYDEEKVRELTEKKVKIQEKRTPEIRVLDGVFELLKFLKEKGYRIAISSSNYMAAIMPMLKEHGLQEYFDVIVTTDNAKVKRLKPYPDAFLITAEELNLPPGECVVFEDSPHGIKAAKEAGMQIVGVCTGPFNKEEVLDEKPDLVVDSLNQIAEIKEFLD